MSGFSIGVVHIDVSDPENRARLCNETVFPAAGRTISDIYRSCVEEYGRCVSSVYRDKRVQDADAGESWRVERIGWVFLKRQPYDDAPRKSYLMETWVIIYSCTDGERTAHVLPAR